MSINQVLGFLDISQSTYSRRKREGKILDKRNSELVLVLWELMDYGVHVFNDEDDKFFRWLRKPNYSLGGIAPVPFFDSVAGIEEVKSTLDRIEFGNLA